MFRFTIRDVLWLTVVVALVVCWLLTSQRAARLQLDNETLTKQAKEVARLREDAVKQILESQTNLLHAKAERDLAEHMRAEAQDAKADSGQFKRTPSR